MNKRFIAPPAGQAFYRVACMISIPGDGLKPRRAFWQDYDCQLFAIVKGVRIRS